MRAINDLSQVDPEELQVVYETGSREVYEQVMELLHRAELSPGLIFPPGPLEGMSYGRMYLEGHFVIAVPLEEGETAGQLIAEWNRQTEENVAVHAREIRYQALRFVIYGAIVVLTIRLVAGNWDTAIASGGIVLLGLLFYSQWRNASRGVVEGEEEDDDDEEEGG